MPLACPAKLLWPGMHPMLGGVVTVEGWFYQSATGTQCIWVPIYAFDQSANPIVTLLVSPGSPPVAQFGLGTVPVSTGVWNDYKLVLDFGAHSVTAFVKA